MNFNLNPDHEKLRALVRDFAENEIKPIAQLLDKNEEFSTELTKKMGDLRLFGMFLPEKYGGINSDTLSYIIAVEEISRIDSSQGSTLAAHNSLGIGPIYQFGTEQQKMNYLPKLSTGEFIWGFGLTERDAGSDSRGTKTTANFKDNKWIINGSKLFITNGSTKITAGSTIQTITGEKEGKKVFTNFLLDQNTPGFTHEPIKGKMMWRASNTSKLYFNNCELSNDQMLGNEGEGSKIMLSTLDNGRLSIAAIGLGLAQGAYEMAKKYAKERKQFGKTINKFQAISFKIADMALKIELARNLLYKACWLKDNNLPFAKESAMAKLYCSEIAKEVADEALQIHGAYGLQKENPIERFYRDQRILQIGEGTSEILKIVIARHIDV